MSSVSGEARTVRHTRSGNRTDSPIRVLMLSTLLVPEIVEYLDSGKIGAPQRPPASGFS